MTGYKSTAAVTWAGLGRALRHGRGGRILLLLGACAVAFGLAAWLPTPSHAKAALSDTVATVAPPSRLTVATPRATPQHHTITAPVPPVCASNAAGRKLLLVSIHQQHLWACDGNQLASSSPVTTGAYALPNVSEATPTGTWEIQGKTTDTNLTGCNADGCWDDAVHYWLPFDGPFGFHDAPWQTMPFGSQNYGTGGSHGCVHLPEAEAAWVYAWAPVGTTVTVEA